MLGSLYLLVLKVQLVPLVPRVEVVSVDIVISSPSGLFKHLVCLAVISLQKFFEVEVAVLPTTLTMNTRLVIIGLFVVFFFVVKGGL